MNGGTIKNCSAKLGGAVYVHAAVADNGTGKGVFTLKNGTISGCQSVQYGGAVNSLGTFTMNGGIITQNQTTGLNTTTTSAGLTQNNRRPGRVASGLLAVRSCA